MGKHIMKKRISTLIAVMMLISSIWGAVYAGSLGSEVFSKSLTISENTVLTNGVFWNSSANDKVTENYIAYRPGGSVIPAVAYGNDIYGAASLKKVVSMAAEKGQRVIAGMNGDFFNMSNGVVIGPVIKDGILRTSESSRFQSIGFYDDGSAFIARMNLNIRVDGEKLGEGISSLNFNKVVSLQSGLMLYSEDFESSTKATIPTVNVILNVDSKPVINGIVNGVVESVTESVGATPIPKGKMLLTMAKDSPYTWVLSRIRQLQSGDNLTLSFGADRAWDDVVMALGGETKLITAGSIVAPSSGKEPRTAVGIKGDGTVIFYTIDGRQAGYSVGATMNELASRLRELGCTEAINLDGGGSTTLQSIYPGDDGLTTINRPSGSALRSCGNYILLINTKEKDGILTYLQPYPYEFQLLTGARQQLTVKALDGAYYPMRLSEEIKYYVDQDMGEVDEKGFFKAGNQSGQGVISVTSGDAYGEAHFNIIETPDSISILDKAGGKPITTLTVVAGKSYDLSALAMYKGTPLLSDDTSFSWTVQGDIGTIDEAGVFTAAKVSSGKGTITASAGGKSAIVSVTGTGSGSLLEGFEGTAYEMWTGTTAPLEVKVTRDLIRVKYGWKSLEATYDFSKTGSGSLAIPTTINFQRSPGAINFWLYGDKSGNEVSVKVRGADGLDWEYGACTVDFAGWRFISVDIPKDIESIISFNIKNKGANKGKLYFDQLMACNGEYMDLTPPAIQLEVNNGNLKGVVTDNLDKDLKTAQLELTYDGKKQSFNFDGTTMTASLPAADGKSHRVAVIAGDESGNLARKAITISGNTMKQPFADMKTHWARENTSYLYEHGIINGTSSKTGLLYKPDVNMTRAEFAMIMSNWMVENTEEYAGVTLPFADVNKIPKWAMNSVKAMYSRGIIQGSSTGGKILFNPANPVTRQEAMTIIGRTQPRGYQEANLTFSDSVSVDDWALPYIKPMVSQGIISGSSDGKLHPRSPITRAQVAKIIYEMN
ncbi:MAG: S-layer homology domain-containing protein [Anaerovoracaceae bacterium]|jgi:hypothetical protein